MTRERGILFSGAMVRALLAGTKTQTRRVVDPKLYIEVEEGAGYTHAVEQSDPAFATAAMEFARCPYGVPGDRLWVRETWAVFSSDAYKYLYGPLKSLGLRKYGGGDPDPGCELRVGTGPAMVAYKANPISPKERDALQAQVALNKHGGQDFGWTWNDDPPTTWRPSLHMPRWASRITLEVTEVRVQRLQDISEEDARAEGLDGLYVRTGPSTIVGRPWATEFALLWDSINGRRVPWSANPWVWAVSFRRVTP